MYYPKGLYCMYKVFLYIVIYNFMQLASQITLRLAYCTKKYQ